MWGEVRSKGLLFGIELVANKETKESLDPALVNKVIGTAKENGVLIGKNGNTIPGLCNVLVLSPTLTVTRSEGDQIVEAIEEGLKAII